MAVTFRQLEIFVAAAKEGNFRSTADALGISQPGLSKQIQALEAALGRKLFERRRGASAILSSDGLQMVETAKEMLDRQKHLIEISDHELLGKIRITAGEYLLDYVIKPALPALYAEFPRVEFEFKLLDSSMHITEVVRSGDADLGIALSRTAHNEASDIVALREAPCSLYVAADRAKAILNSKEALAVEPLSLPGGSIARQWAQDALSAAGLNLDRPTLQVQFGDVLAEMVRRGEGMGVLFEEHVRNRYGEQLCRLPFQLPSVRWLLVRGAKLEAPNSEKLINRFAELVGSTTK